MTFDTFNWHRESKRRLAEVRLRTKKYTKRQQQHFAYLIFNSVRSSCCCDLLIEENLETGIEERDSGARIMEDFDISDSDTDESMRMIMMRTMHALTGTGRSCKE